MLCINATKHKVHLFFLFDLFLEARAEILTNFFGFLVDLKTPKRHLEINWPLVYVYWHIFWQSSYPLSRFMGGIWLILYYLFATHVFSNSTVNKVTKIHQMTMVWLHFTYPVLMVISRLLKYSWKTLWF